MTRLQLYKKWRNWVDYTMNPAVKTYPSQGGRGIKICARWKNFDNFYNDIIKLPKPKGCDQLTRKDPAKDYKPGNMMWDTRKGYGNRRTDCVYIKYQGKKLSIRSWADTKGIPYGVLQRRIKIGWSARRAIETPVRHTHV